MKVSSDVQNDYSERVVSLTFAGRQFSGSYRLQADVFHASLRVGFGIFYDGGACPWMTVDLSSFSWLHWSRVRTLYHELMFVIHWMTGCADAVHSSFHFLAWFFSLCQVQTCQLLRFYWETGSFNPLQASLFHILSSRFFGVSIATFPKIV